MSLEHFTLSQAHQGLVEKKFSASELTKEYVLRAQKNEKDHHAFISFTDDYALEAAKVTDEKIARGEKIGMLEGIPVAVKDNMMMAGIQTTAGSKMLENYSAAYDATIVKKLKEQGAAIMGKTNMDEFAMGTTTEHSAFGPTRNPWDTSRVPGGSSGGSAAAVAADSCIYALGSDTGGSIRQPAGLCGVTGLKPTYGTVSRYGLIAMASSLDQIGPLAKSAEDAAFIFDAIKGPDTYDSSSAHASLEPTYPHLKKSIAGMKIGLPKEYFIEGMDKRIEKIIQDACTVLREAGAELIDVELPHAPYALSVYYVICPAEVSANMSRFDGIRYGYSEQGVDDLGAVYRKSRGHGLGEEVRRRIMLGTYVLAAGYYDAYYKQAQKVRMCVRRDFDEVFRKVDCLITPTSPSPAFRLGEKTNDPLAMYLEDIFTVSANIAGVPGLVVPAGFVQEDGKSLPVGMQLLGRHFDEATLLRVGHQYQQITDWHLKNPQS